MKKILMVVGASALLAGCNVSWLPVPQARMQSQTYGQFGSAPFPSPHMEIQLVEEVNKKTQVRTIKRTGTRFDSVTGRFYTLAGSLGVRINQMQVEMLVNNVAVYKTPNMPVQFNVNSGFRCPKQDALVISGPGAVPDCVYADKDTTPGDSVDARSLPIIPLFSDSKLVNEIAKMVYSNNPAINTTAAPDISLATTQFKITYSGVDTNLNAFSHTEVTTFLVNSSAPQEIDITPP